VGIDEVRRRVGDGVALQGNLDPGALFAPPAEIRARVADILARAGSVGHIFNLGHGVLPETDPEHVRAMVTAVRELSQQA
jgi:uroporphyrinogen decarboxylase